MNTLKTKGLCEYRWLSESTGFSGTEAAINNGEYELRQIYTKDSKVCGIAVDFDEQNPSVQDIGTFIVPFS